MRWFHQSYKMNASKVKDQSYAPYSGRQAACILESDQGHFFPGVRIENASFPLTIHEAQNALCTCLSEGEHPRAIYTKDPEDRYLDFWKKEYALSSYTLDKPEEITFEPVILADYEQPLPVRLEALWSRALVSNSGFPVSSLLETDQGYISGVNIECSEWSLGLCAERTALAKALSYGIKEFKALHIYARYGAFSSPCGACRQVIIEHMPHHPVYLYHTDGTCSMHYSSDLLPYGFRSAALKKS